MSGEQEWYYVDLNGGQNGPCDDSVIINAWKKNEIDGACLCWNPGLSNWQTIDATSELKQSIAKATAAPAKPAPLPQRPLPAPAPVRPSSNDVQSATNATSPDAGISQSTTGFAAGRSQVLHYRTSSFCSMTNSSMWFMLSQPAPTLQGRWAAVLSTASQQLQLDAHRSPMQQLPMRRPIEHTRDHRCHHRISNSHKPTACQTVMASTLSHRS